MLSKPPPYCYFIADSSYGCARLPRLVEAALRGGVHIVQLRGSAVPLSEQEELAIQLKDMVASHKAIFLINDAPRLCHKIGADGVHLGWQDMPPQQARLLLGEEAILGLTIHNAHQARTADYENINYVSIGSVFPSRTKVRKNSLGIDNLRSLIGVVGRHSSLPVFCIGGINIDNVFQLRDLDLAGVALCAGIAAAADPTAACRQLRAALQLWKRAAS